MGAICCTARDLEIKYGFGEYYKFRQQVAQLYDGNAGAITGTSFA